MSTGTEPLFNIALLPINNTTAENFLEAAKPFANTADGYLLGPGALPHVTLSHFRASNEDAARQAFSSWQDKKDLSIKLTAMRIKPGIGQHENTWWPEIETTRDDALLGLQKACYKHLIGLGLTALNDPEIYRPHFTLARCRHKIAEPTNNPENLPAGLMIPCKLALGQSSENGVFLKVIAP